VTCVLSKVNSQKFIFVALIPLSSTRRQVRKMETSGEQKSFCALDFHVYKSVVNVQRHFRTTFGTDPPSGKSVLKWYLQFQDTGCICKRKSTERPSTEEEAVEPVRTSSVRSPRKSTYRANRELGIPQKTVWRVLRKRLQTRPYRLQSLQALKNSDLELRASSCADLLGLMEEDGFPERLVFSDILKFVMCLKKFCLPALYSTRVINY
jgi:hypothetical protein